mmetsp:Transcript_17043/g.14988  ORF Transcript_17043/g.14988 Transcript_17043/m.14988 type:complete len:223 (-) Transcript_17043:86-754(-)
MSIVLQVLNWGIYYWMVAYGEKENCENGTGAFTDKVLYKFQAQVNYEVVYGWQWWRLATAGYVHGDYDHCFGNMTGIYFTSMILEWSVGPWHLFNIYNFINFFGNVTSGIFYPDSIGVGASTAVYGFYGAMLGLVLKQKYGMRSETNFIFLFPTAYWTINILINNFSSAGDVVAHGSGWVLGVFYTIIWLPDLNMKGGWKNQTYRDIFYWGSIAVVGGANLF